MTHIDLDIDACGRDALDYIADMFAGRDPAERVARLPAWFRESRSQQSDNAFGGGMPVFIITSDRA